MLEMNFLMSATVEVLAERVRALLGVAGQGALDFLLAALVMLIGWALARLVGQLVLWILRLARFNQGVRQLLGPRATAATLEPAKVAARLVTWTLLVLAAIIASDALGFDLGGSVGERLREVLPRVLAAAIELFVGILVAVALGEVTRRLFEGAGVRHSRLRGQIVSGVLGGFAVLVALEELGIAAQFIVALGVTATAAVGLAAALAFGLGCRELARDFVVEYLRSLDDGPAKHPE